MRPGRRLRPSLPCGKHRKPRTQGRGNYPTGLRSWSAGSAMLSSAWDSVGSGGFELARAAAMSSSCQRTGSHNTPVSRRSLNTRATDAVGKCRRHAPPIQRSGRHPPRDERAMPWLTVGCRACSTTESDTPSPPVETPAADDLRARAQCHRDARSAGQCGSRRGICHVDDLRALCVAFTPSLARVRSFAAACCSTSWGTRGRSGWLRWPWSSRCSVARL
jgi:hypothetical protein